MFERKQITNGFQILFSASFDNINLVCSEVEEFLTNNAIQCDVFEIEVGLREMLTNAVRHGSGNDPGKVVTFSLHCFGDSLTVTVKDEGKGFDWQSASKHISNLTETSGRGMGILQNFFDTIIFNHTGNEITCVKNITSK